MSRMRVAIAGTGGLARIIAHSIGAETTHQVVLLSRNQQPQLTALGYQVTVIDYSDPETLHFALLGIDTVISTVTGTGQVELIKAAVRARVRRFAPAEFEGLPQLRSTDDPTDRNRRVARQWLAHFAQHIQSTVFVCGILYERLQPGGLASSRIGAALGLGGEGTYMMDCRNMTAQVPAYESDDNNPCAICMTAVQDVGRFVTRSLDLLFWPPELRMCGHRLLVKDLVLEIQRLKGQTFNIQWYTPIMLESELQVAIAHGDISRQMRIRALINTAEGHYDFVQPNLNQHFCDVRTIDFGSWFSSQWRT